MGDRPLFMSPISNLKLEVNFLCTPDTHEFLQLFKQYHTDYDLIISKLHR